MARISRSRFARWDVAWVWAWAAARGVIGVVAMAWTVVIRR